MRHKSCVPRRRSRVIRIASAVLIAIGIEFSYDVAFADDPLCVIWSSNPTVDGDIAGDLAWKGGNQYVFSNGTTQPDAVVQMTRNASTIYFSFEVNNDPEYNEKDVIILLLGPSAADPTQDRRIHIYPVSNSGNGTNQPPRVIHTWTNSNTWAANAANPTVNPAWIVARVTAAATGLNLYSYRVEASIAIGPTGINLPSAATQLKLHFNVLRLYTSTSGGITETRADQLNWPTAATVPGVPANPTDTQLFSNPPRTSWGDALLPSSTSGCQGVRVKSRWINSIGNNVLAVPPAPSGSVTNNYYVEIENAGTVDAGHILATIHSSRFGIAPYPGFGKVPATPNPVSSFSAAQPGPIGPNQTRTLGPAAWPITRAQYEADFENNPLVCSYITLDVDNSNTAGVTRTLIANRYFSWNIGFGSGSTFDHVAVLQTRGFERPTNGDTVQRFDILVSDRQIAPRTRMRPPRERQVMRDSVRIGSHDTIALAMEMSQVGTIGAVYDKGAQLFARTVCAFRHTSSLIKVDGTVVRIMERTPCYGYWIYHEGAFTSWRQSFQAPGLLKLAGTGTLYTLAVPIDSAVNLTTQIEAVERGYPGPWPWWVWLLIVLALLVVIALVRRRRSP